MKFIYLKYFNFKKVKIAMFNFLKIEIYLLKYFNFKKVKINMFNNQIKSDFKITDQCETIYLHKIILMNNNEYFKKMFSGKFLEENELVVKYIKPYKIIFEYLYYEQISLDLANLTYEELYEFFNYSEQILIIKEDDLCVIIKKFILENIEKIVQNFNQDLLFIINNFLLNLKDESINAQNITKSNLLKLFEIELQKISLSQLVSLTLDLYNILQNYLSLRQKSYFLFFKKNYIEIDKLDIKAIVDLVRNNFDNHLYKLLWDSFGNDFMKYFFDDIYEIIKFYPPLIKIHLGKINNQTLDKKIICINSLLCNFTKKDVFLISINEKLIEYKLENIYFFDLKKNQLTNFILDEANYGMNISIKLDETQEKLDQIMKDVNVFAYRKIENENIK